MKIYHLNEQGNKIMVTHRTAEAVVRNQRSNKIVSVQMVHKYSDNYTNSQRWENVAISQDTQPPLKVEYHTGAFTTGRDWWFVVWVEEDGHAYVSSPNNLQGLLNFMESPIREVAFLLKDIFAPDQQESIGSEIGNKANKLLDQINKEVTRNDSTSGFKQHILRSDDDNQKVVITLANEIIINSPSGESKTNIASLNE